MKKNSVLSFFLIVFLACSNTNKNTNTLFEKLSYLDKTVQSGAPYFEFKFITKDSLQLYGQGWQPATEPKAVICLLHGLGEHSGLYKQLAEVLNDSGFTLVSFDLRGHGKSQGQQGHFPNYHTLMVDITLFLKEVKKHFKNIPLFLYGHSLGGNLVINYSLQYNPRFAGVIATSPLIRTAFDPPAWKIILGKTMYYLWPKLSLSNGIDLNDLSRDTNVIRSRKNDVLCHDRVTTRFLDVFKKGQWALVNAERLDIHLLIMHGDADRITSVDASREFAENAGTLCTLKIWQGLYHSLHEEPEKELVFQYLIKWMNDKI